MSIDDFKKVSRRRRRLCRWLLTISLIVAALPAWCAAQQSSGPSAAKGTGANPLAQMPEAQRARQSAPDDDQSSPTFRVNVKLVNVFATVVDQSGAPVGGLTKQDFSLYEDDKPQKIAVFNRESGLPLSIVLEVDTSLSTHKDLQLELQSARRFTHTILRPVDALALFQFSEIVDELTPFTSDLRRIDNAIEHVHPGAATAMYDALYLGARALGRRQGRKVMVVITDGGDTVSTTDYGQALRAAQEAEAIVYSIIVVPIEADAGRDIGGEHALIQLAHDTGGKYFYASGINQLDEAFRKISDELRTQYLLAYYPSERLSDSDFRRIKIVVNTPAGKDWAVRARTGYYTSKAE